MSNTTWFYFLGYFQFWVRSKLWKDSIKLFFVNIKSFHLYKLSACATEVFLFKIKKGQETQYRSYSLKNMFNFFFLFFLTLGHLFCALISWNKIFFVWTFHVNLASIKSKRHFLLKLRHKHLVRFYLLKPLCICQGNFQRKSINYVFFFNDKGRIFYFCIKLKNPVEKYWNIKTSDSHVLSWNDSVDTLRLIIEGEALTFN